MRFIQFVRKHLNTWEEICLDENARLRTNVIIFTFAVTLFYLAMLVINTIFRHNFNMLYPVAILAAISISIFTIQFISPDYSPVIAWIFGFMALGMSAFLLYSGGADGLSYLWVYIVPIIAVMVVSLRGGLIYNCLLILMLVIMLKTPLHDQLALQYSPAFRTTYPISVAFVAICVLIGEIVRSNTQKRLAQTTEQMQSFAFTDPLTHIYNRRAMASHFGPDDEPAYGLFFAIMDLDHFKRVNDVYGHAVGDEMLCHVVDNILQIIPPNAFLYRWGGEEFLLTLKTTNQEEGETTLQHIRRKIEATPLIHGNGAIPVTISIGGVCANKNTTIASCIRQADACLYTAKENGRNQVVLADNDSPASSTADKSEIL